VFDMNFKQLKHCGHFYCRVLGLIILGCWWFEPTFYMVGGLYLRFDDRRDKGFTIFYIEFNVGAFLFALVLVLGELWMALWFRISRNRFGI